jgi:hypothetical protein
MPWLKYQDKGLHISADTLTVIGWLVATAGTILFIAWWVGTTLADSIINLY